MIWDNFLTIAQNTQAKGVDKVWQMAETNSTLTATLNLQG
jgi:hypothetical protein